MYISSKGLQLLTDHPDFISQVSQINIFVLHLSQAQWWGLTDFSGVPLDSQWCYRQTSGKRSLDEKRVSFNLAPKIWPFMFDFLLLCVVNICTFIYTHYYTDPNSNTFIQKYSLFFNPLLPPWFTPFNLF